MEEEERGLESGRGKGYKALDGWWKSGRMAGKRREGGDEGKARGREGARVGGWREVTGGFTHEHITFTGNLAALWWIYLGRQG